MLNFFYYIFIFIFIHLIVFSYGLQFKKLFLYKINFSIGEIGLLGFVSVYTLTIFIHFFSSITLNISLFFYFFGIVFLWNNLKLLNQISYKEIKPLAYIIIFTFFFSLTTSLHDDTYLYQLSTINYLQQSKIIFGIQGIYDLLAYGHGFYNIMSIFQFPFVNNSALFLVPIVFFNFFIFTCFIFFKENKNSVLNFFLIIIFLIFCFRYNRFSTFGADIAPLSIIFLLQIYVIDFFKNKNFDNFEKFLIFLLFGIFLKFYVVSSFFLLFVFIFFLKKKIFFILKKKSLKIIITITFVSLSNNFIQSGCLFYPVSVTCFDKNIISWGAGKDVSKVRELKQRAEAKGIKSYIRLSKFSENKENYIANIKPKEYLEKFKYSYLKYIFKDPDFKKLLVIFIITFTVFFFSLFSKNKIKYLFSKNHKYLLNFVVLLSLISWLIVGPQSRYGGNAYLAFFLFVIFFINYEKNIKILNKSFFNYIFIFALVFFIGKNFNRYFKEYKTISYNYNFPFSSYEKISYTSLKYDYFNLQIANHDLGCGVVKFPCIVKDYEYAVTSVDKKSGYLFLKSDNKILIKNINQEHYKLNFLWNNG